MKQKTNKVICPCCSSKKIKKHGIKNKKLQSIQRYFCKSCEKTFTLQSQAKNKTYPLKDILTAISFYNKGHSQSQIQKMLKAIQKPSQKTISNWIKEYVSITTFSRLREEAKRQYSPDSIIEQYEFLHNNLNYKYQIHNFKLNYLTSNNEKLQRLKNYLEKIPTSDFPHHIFKPNSGLGNKSDRASQAEFKTLNLDQLEKHNLANKLCSLALTLAKNNKDRHQAIQDFMLTNDSTTIAAEIPIYLTHDDLLYFNSHNFSLNPNDFNTPITGHIDILQIRNNLIHILDYKPSAKKEKPVEQLTIYALALASKIKLPLTSFKCAWFDESNYYEFFPLHAVYKLRKEKSFQENKKG